MFRFPQDRVAMAPCDTSLNMMHTIGQRLKAEREQQKLTIEKVFEATRIRMQYIQALEADDLSVMPSPVQARGYLRNYAEYLGLNVDQLLNELREMSAQQSSGEVIGPADEISPVAQPQPASAAIDTVPVAPHPEPPVVLQEEPGVVEEITVPVKPKPARRKKIEDNDGEPRPTIKSSADRPASAEAATKRRGRKKTESAFGPSIETSSEVVEEPIAPVEFVQPSEHIEESTAQNESVPLPESAEQSSKSDASLNVPTQGESIRFEPDAPQQNDVSDTLWQTWLNRLGSVLSARMRRPTLTPKESPVLEAEPVVTLPEPEIIEEEQPFNGSVERSIDIFKEIGRELRTRRELLSLHFDEVERNTHVKAHYLDALERGALDELPSTVQTRGMLSNYATFLDLDVDALLLRFADALQARHRERNPQKAVRKPDQPIVGNIPPVRSFIAGDVIFGVSMAILLIGFAVWGVSRVMTIQSQREAKPTAPSISEVLLASPDASLITPTAVFAPVEEFPAEATVTVEIPTQNVNAAVQLNLIAVERTYMRVTVDGKVAFEGRVVPGNAYPFEAENQIEVLVGSGAAIRTVYNGRDLGLMGTFGQIVNNIYSGTEVITPTALPTITATISPTPTTTPPPTATSRFTPTPVTATPAPSATAVP